MKNSKGVSLIALIITIIVIIILAAIVMNSSGDTVTQAQYAKFAQEFGEFESQVKLDSATVKQNTGLRGQTINPAQQYYMTANGFTFIQQVSGNANGLNQNQGVAGYAMPVGYVLTNDNTTDAATKYILQEILNVGTSGDRADMKTPDQHVAYVINDGVITNYTKYGDNSSTTGEASHEFYGDSNGKEYHFITSDGNVFTLPGYPVTQSDGSIEYHIDTQNGHYYVVAGNSGKGVNTENVNGDKIACTQPIQAEYLQHVRGINAITGASISGEKSTPNLLAQYTVKVGPWNKMP